MPHNPTRTRVEYAENLTASAIKSNGMLFLVTGVTGTGKTYFLRTLGEYIDRENLGPVHYVSADEFEHGIPYSFIERILSAGLSRNAQIDPQTPAAEVASRLLHALVELPEEALRTVLIDNAHWIDDASVRVLRYIIPRVVQQRVILGFATRYRDYPESFAAHLSQVTDANPQHQRFDFAPLEVEEIRSLALERLGTGISTRAAERIRGATGGTFLGVDRVFDQLTPDEVSQLHLTWDLPVRGGRPLADDPMLRPFFALDEAGQLAVEIVSLASQDLSISAVQRVAEMVDGTVDIDAGRASSLIVESGFGTTVAPAHSLIACSLKQRLDPERTRRISRALATVTDGFVAITHALNGADQWDAELESMVDQYVERALAQQSFTNANEVLRASLKLATGETRERLLLDLVLLNLRNKTGFAALEFLADVQTLPPSLLRECLEIILGIYRFEERFSEQRLATALAVETDDPDARTILSFLAFLSVIMVMRSENPEAIEQFVPRARELWARAPEDAAELSDARLAWMVAPREYELILDGYALVPLCFQYRSAEVAAALPDLIARTRALPDSAHKVDALVPLAGAAMSIGDIDLANELSSLGAGLLGTVERPWAAGTIRVIHTHTLILQGRLADAQQLLGEAEELIYEFLEVEVRLTFAALHAWVAALTGAEYPHAHLAAASRLSELHWEGYGVDFAVMAECEIARVARDPQAIIDATEPPRVARFIGTRRGFLSYRAHALLDVGRLDDAEALVAELAELKGTRWFEAWGSLEWLRARIAEARVVRHGESAELPDHHYRAALDGVNTPLVEALTRSDYAAYLVSRGRASDAQGQMHRATELVSRIGARAYLPRLTDQASALGNPEGTVHLDLLATLTPREDEIARYLADGRSTKFISEALFVSPATVRFHVANVLRKLQVSSRNEVSRVFRGPLQTP